MRVMKKLECLFLTAHADCQKRDIIKMISMVMRRLYVTFSISGYIIEDIVN